MPDSAKVVFKPVQNTENVETVFSPKIKTRKSSLTVTQKVVKNEFVSIKNYLISFLI